MVQNFNVGLRFHNQDDLRRVSGAYIFYKGQPRYVALTGGYKARLTFPGDPTVKEENIDLQEDEDVDLASPELGFLNAGDGDCRYIYRKPRRQWHYLAEMNCGYYSLFNKASGNCANGSFFTKEFGKTLMGEYPKYQILMKAVANKPLIYAKAFDRYFALLYKAGKLALFYRDEKIADYKEAEKLWVIDKKYDYPTFLDRLEEHGLDFGV